MARNRRVTLRQIEDAYDTLQRLLETETFTLTTIERAEMMKVKKSLRLLAEIRKEGK